MAINDTKLQQPVRYQSYLVRLWRDGARGPWRFSIQHVTTGEKHFFADLAGLFTFLQVQVENVEHKE